MAKLEIEIGAVTKDLTNSLKDADKKLQTFSKQAQNSGKAISAASVANKTASGSINKLKGELSGANTVALEFNRIVQDAPFGIIGVGNNIQQLAGNFSGLSKQAGGAIPAIKAAFSALATGPNLALLAISAVTAGITAYQMGAFDFAKSTKKAAEEAQKFSEELDNFKKSLDGVAASQLQGRKDAQAEIINLKALRSQAENVNLSLNDRLAAVDELKQLYPQYLGNLTDEEIRTGKVGDAYKNLNERLIQTAKAKAALGRITENTNKIFDIEERTLERVNAILEARNRIEKLRTSFNQTTGLKVAGQVTAQNNELIQAQKELNRLQKEQVSDIEAINKINEENARLQDKVTGSVITTGKAAETANEKTKTALQIFQEYAKKVFSDLLSYFSDFNKRLSQAITQAGKDVKDLPFFEANIGISGAPVVEIPEVDESSRTKFLNSLKGLAVEINAIFQEFIAGTLTDVSFAIGEALTTGANLFETIGKSLLNSISNFLGQLGKQLIAYGVAGLAFSNASKGLLTPLTAGPSAAALIAAGTSLTVISGAISGILKKSGGIGGGTAGVGSGDSFRGSGVNSTVFDSLGGLQVSGTSTIKGTDIVIAFNKANRTNGR